MIFRVVHRTEYEYDQDVSASYGEAYLCPREAPGQHTYTSTVAVDPVPEHFRERRDYFGNRATHFTVLAPHRELTVTATSVVDVRARPVATAAVGDVAWDEVRDLVGTDESPETFDARQYRLPSDVVPPSAAALGYAAESFPPGRPLVAALDHLTGRLHEEFDFSPGATTVSTPVDEVLARRVGVCQDFAHLTIAGLRGLGLPVRYVSGYLQTDPPPGSPRLVGADVSHAWVSVHVPQVGWLDLDPTNHQWVDGRYVTVAWGRDYADVPPLKGVIFTESEKQSLRVTVDVEELAADDPDLADLPH